MTFIFLFIVTILFVLLCKLILNARPRPPQASVWLIQIYAMYLHGSNGATARTDNSAVTIASSKFNE